MLQTKKIDKETVAVSFAPTEIYIRKSGKEYIRKEKCLIKIKGKEVIISQKVLEEFGFKLTME